MNETEKNASIQYILSQGVVKPITAKERMTKMLRTIGFRFIFWDTGYSLLFASITLAGIVALFKLAPVDYRYSAAIAAAPLLFLIVTLFAETSERAGGIYELKQTCHYTIRQITALRIACYSVVGSVFTTIIAALHANNGYEFLSLFPLCLSALFICAVLGLSAIRMLHNAWGYAAFSAIWVFVNIMLPISLGDKWEALLRATPVVLSTAVAVMGAALLIYGIVKMLSEEKKYAAA
ncbi:hypothetical protein M6D81_28165 [Paenibacillus sp. J5C_2022]|uniref:hypothetical protein n=1 Tax=Paenibacillus sp. J5C2022 TaxID=2977129 RepID=UPI0021D0A721|nr:hypothetical protein [Paenibacillus sp. J5C2022]MCU6712580.1 hypothetical protein [Paenibacillus sp. J5C2022]